VCLVGDSSTGKTALFNLSRPNRHIPLNYRPTIAAKLAAINRSIGSGHVIARLWDTPGSERFRDLFDVYLRNTSGVFLVYDVCRRSTFTSLPNWLSIIRSVCPNDAVIVLIANKSRDSGREVTESEGAEFARQNSLPFSENDFGSGIGFEASLFAMLIAISSSNPDGSRRSATVDQIPSISEEFHECNSEIRARLSPSLSAVTESPRWLAPRFGFGSHGTAAPPSSPPATPLSEPKVVMLGGTAPGKSWLLCRWRCDSCPGNISSTVGASDFRVSRIIDGDDVTVRIWDTPGQERFFCHVPLYLRGASGIFLVFSVTEKSTFEALSFQLAVVRENCPPDTIIMVIGNKIDLVDRREVTESEGAAFARENSLLYFETSAKTGDGVEAPLLAMMREVTYVHECRWILGINDQS
jgi:small GTP-binding protein